MPLFLLRQAGSTGLRPNGTLDPAHSLRPANRNRRQGTNVVAAANMRYPRGKSDLREAGMIRLIAALLLSGFGLLYYVLFEIRSAGSLLEKVQRVGTEKKILGLSRD